MGVLDLMIVNMGLDIQVRYIYDGYNWDHLNGLVSGGEHSLGNK